MGLRLDKEQKNNSHNHDKHEETRPAPFVLLGTDSDIVYRKRKSMLDTVDTFMFGTMILIQAPDILHSGNQPDIADKDQNPDHTFENRPDNIGRNDRLEQI